MACLDPRLVFAHGRPMKQQGWSVIGVALICGLMSGAILSAWMDLMGSQKARTQRSWLMQSRAAAEALIRETHSGWKQAPAAPASGCLRGRCAWQGDAALAPSFWLKQVGQAGTWGVFTGSASMNSGWPTLPGSLLWCWLETTPTADGTLVRITTWVQGPNGNGNTVMQAVWLSSSTGVDDSWISWREVMP